MGDGGYFFFLVLFCYFLKIMSMCHFYKKQIHCKIRAIIFRDCKEKSIWKVAKCKSRRNCLIDREKSTEGASTFFLSAQTGCHRLSGLSITQICFLQFWRMGSPRSDHYDLLCSRAHFLVHQWPFSCCVHVTKEGRKKLSEISLYSKH